MKVKVQFISPRIGTHETTGENKIEVELPEGAGINELVEHLSKRFGNSFLESLYISDMGVTSPYIVVIIDGKATVLSKSKNYKLKDNSVVYFLEPIGGG